MRRSFLIQSLWKSISSTVIVTFLFLGCSSQANKHKTVHIAKPNVILIYADDLGFGDISCYNPNSKIKTPHIDRLAKQGMMFRDAHSPASFCTPSRYSILTGNYCWRSEEASSLQGGYGLPIIKQDEMTLGNLFQLNGYKTAACGKWHVGMQWTLMNSELEQQEENIDFKAPLKLTPIDQGFDYFFGTSGCPTDDPPFAYIENRQIIGHPLQRKSYEMIVGNGGQTAVWDEVLTGQGYTHETTDIAFTDKAIKFIEQQTKNKKPFFVYLPYSLPHIPWEPASFVKGTTGAGPRGDLVALLDHCVGQVTSTLERLGVDDNTIIIFSSDNGPREGELGHSASGPWRGFKGDIYEGGHRVPFIVKWPGKVTKNSVSDELVSQVDLFSTFATLLNYPLKPKDAIDSIDFSAVLLGQNYDKPVRQDHVHLFYAVRKGDWKLTFDVPDFDSNPDQTFVAEELFNLKVDPAEKNNVINDHRDIVKDLRALFIKYHTQGYSRPM